MLVSSYKLLVSREPILREMLCIPLKALPFTLSYEHNPIEVYTMKTKTNIKAGMEDHSFVHV